MNEIGTISNQPAIAPGLIEHLPPQRPQRLDSPGSEVAGDRVELSAGVAECDIRAEQEHALEQRISDLRARIADGTYLTPDKIDVVVEGLYRELFGH